MKLTGALSLLSSESVLGSRPVIDNVRQQLVDDHEDV
jgi:hypothetical protein